MFHDSCLSHPWSYMTEFSQWIILDSSLSSSLSHLHPWVQVPPYALSSTQLGVVCWIEPHSRSSSLTVAPSLALAWAWLNHRWWLSLPLPPESWDDRNWVLGFFRALRCLIVKGDLISMGPGGAGAGDKLLFWKTDGLRWGKWICVRRICSALSFCSNTGCRLWRVAVSVYARACAYLWSLCWISSFDVRGAHPW